MGAFPFVGLLLSLSAGLASAPVPSAGALYSDGPDGMYLLASGWTGRADPQGIGLRRGWFKTGADGGFKPATVPSAFNVQRRDQAGFNAGVYWYREHFTLPFRLFASGWRIRFEGVDRRALVFLNGRFIGSADTPWLPTELRAAAIHGGENVLAVRVDGRPRNTDLLPADRPAGWWNYAGLVREVYLRRVGAFDLRDVAITTTMRGGDAIVHVAGQVFNTGSVRGAARLSGVQVAAPGGSLRPARATTSPPVSLGPGRHAAVRAVFAIHAARLWSPEHPALYEVDLTVPGGQRTVEHVGVRTWKKTADGRVLLNGKPIALHGASFHEQAPGRGSALRPADRAQLVTELANLGADFARAHYPPHPALLDAFDRLGIVYWEEIPVWRLRGPQLAAKTGTALGLLRRMILRDRNHASVMVWGAENETLRGGAAESSYLARARALVRSLDPTRLLGAEAPLRPLGQLGPALREVDALGMNEYLGWYGGRISDAPRDFATVRRRYPGRALFVTEVGAEASRPGRPSELGTYAFQRNFLTAQLAELARIPGINGVLVWILRDFVARPGWSGGDPHPRPPVSAKGLLHQDGTPKPAFAAVGKVFGPRRSRPGNAP